MPNRKARTKVLPSVDFDLAPTAPSTLPTIRKRKPKRRKATDDTPKAFTRLLARQPGSKRNDLDDGPSKKAAAPAAPRLQIQPHESMREFSRRVDEAIPVKFPRGEGGLGAGREKKKSEQRALLKEEAREKEELELDEEEDPEVDLWADPAFHGRKKGKRRAASPDPWKVLESKRAKVKFGETAEAPPVLKKPRAVFKVRDGAGVDVDGVPRKSGSLMKREELAEERRGVVEAYRKMMEKKRGQGASEE